MIDCTFDTITTCNRGDRNQEHALASATYNLTVDGIVEPKEHQSLSSATAALWAILDSLPISPTERQAYRWFLAEPDRVHDFIDRDGQMSFKFNLGGTPYTAVIKPTD
ncbi:hypothetical protein [Kitasatospora sp. NPDC001683]